MNHLYTNRKENREGIFHLILAVMVSLTLFGCGDFKDEPPTPVEPPKTTPESPQTPQAPSVPPPPTPTTPPIHAPSVEKMNQMCEAERQWALSAGLIDINQLRLFQKRNFAPVFNTPGERQIDGWVACAKALEINGFVTPQRNKPEGPARRTPQPLTEPKAPENPQPEPPPKPTFPQPPQIPPLPQNPRAPENPPPSVEKMNEMCEAERQWAFSAGLIDINLLRFFQRRNFAPVFNTPGERQSGADSWYPCEKALEINGFIRN